MAVANPLDFILETANAPGTGNFLLAGTSTGRRTWAAAYATGAQVYYSATDGASWEEGYGTFTTGSPNTLSRTVIENSAGTTAAINFTGSVQVYGEIPGKRAIYADADNSNVPFGSRRLSGLGAATAVSDAPRLDQVAWEQVGATTVLGTATSAVYFSFSTTYERYRVEFERITVASGGSLQFGVSQDSFSSLISSTNSYYANTLALTNGSPSGFSGLGSYVVLTSAGAGWQRGFIEIDPLTGSFETRAHTGTASGDSMLQTGGLVPGQTLRLTGLVIYGSGSNNLAVGSRLRLLGARF